MALQEAVVVQVAIQMVEAVVVQVAIQMAEAVEVLVAYLFFYASLRQTCQQLYFFGPALPPCPGAIVLIHTLFSCFLILKPYQHLLQLPAE